MGLSRFSVEKSFSHSAEKFRRGILHCITHFRYRKILGIKGMGKHQNYPPKFFCLLVPNISSGNPFLQCFRIFPVAKNIMDKKGVDIRILRAENFLSLPKKFVGQLCCAVFQKYAGSEKVNG